MSHDSDPSADDLQFALQEVRTLLLQQILATETGLLSVAELEYRNRGEDDINKENIRYHLRKMAERDIVAKEKVPSGQRVRDLPNTFFTVTDYGEAILEQANLLAESDLWTEMYEQMERTEEIERIEQLKRQFSGREDRSNSTDTVEVETATIEFSTEEVLTEIRDTRSAGELGTNGLIDRVSISGRRQTRGVT